MNWKLQLHKFQAISLICSIGLLFFGKFIGAPNLAGLYFIIAFASLFFTGLLKFYEDDVAKATALCSASAMFFSSWLLYHNILTLVFLIFVILATITFALDAVDEERGLSKRYIILSLLLHFSFNLVPVLHDLHVF